MSGTAFPPFHLSRTATLACTLLLTAPVQAGLLDDIKVRQHMVLAHRDASIPFSYVDKNNQPMGYAIDICRRLVEAVRVHLGMPNLTVKYLPVTSTSRIPAIAERKADLECGSTTNNAERRKLVDYTIAHFISASRLAVRKDSGLTTLQAMKGMRVATTKGSTNLKALRRLNTEQLLEMDIIEASDHAEGFAMMADGRAAAFAMDDVLLYGLIATSERPDAYLVVGKIMSIEPYAITMPKHEPEFKKLIDDTMRSIIASREIHTLYRTWFESSIPPNAYNLKLPMPYLLRDSFKYPSDRVDDWYRE